MRDDLRPRLIRRVSHARPKPKIGTYAPDTLFSSYCCLRVRGNRKLRSRALAYGHDLGPRAPRAHDAVAGARSRDPVRFRTTFDYSPLQESEPSAEEFKIYRAEICGRIIRYGVAASASKVCQDPQAPRIP